MRLSSIQLLVACLFVSAVAAFGQGGTGTITGIVTDTGGLVVANAAVQAKNVANGAVYSAQSTETGNYSIAPLPYGTYEVSVTFMGFKKYVHANMLVEVGQILREDVQLQVGSAAESITVTAEATLLKTESGDLSHEVTVTQMQELPILSVGGGGGTASSGFRNPWAVALLIPGTQYVSNSSLSVNGSATSYSIRIEGMDAQMDGANIIYTQRVQPSVDAIQEVAIQTSNFAAEFGTVGGGLFNVSMKSGTNQYHGNAYDYIVNEALNAHQPYTGQRSQQRRQDYGGTAGGPVWIPKVYDGRNKTFFFFSYERFVEHLNYTTPPPSLFGAGTYPTVPTTDYRTGNFSAVIGGSGTNGVPNIIQASGKPYLDPLGRQIQAGMIFDPASERPVVCSAAVTPNCAAGTTVLVRDQFAGNTIDPTRFDKVAFAIQQKYIPQPTVANQLGQNYHFPSLASGRTSNLPSIKVDQQIGTKGHLSGYYQLTGTESQFSAPNGNIEGLPVPITVARGTFIHSKIARINYDHTLTPTMLLHLGVGYEQQDFDDHAPVTDYNALKEIGLPGATVNRTFPQFVIAQSLAIGGMNNMGPAAQGPFKEFKPAANANATWVKASHSYKLGAEWRATGFPTYSLSNTSGVYTTAASATGQTALQNITTTNGSPGFAYASFLLGDLTAATLNAPIAAKTGQQQWGLFIQDTWKVSRKLTLDYGLRWDYGTYSAEEHGRYGNFSFTTPNPSAGGHPGAVIYEAQCQCAFAKNYPYQIGPRLGFAYQAISKTVLRGGFGIVYAPVGTVSGSTTNTANAGNVAFDQHLPFQLQDGVVSLHPVWPAFDPANNVAPGVVATAPTLIDPNAGRPARQYQWSLGIQREISRNLVVEATYVGNRVGWLSSGNALVANNALSQQLLAKYGFTDFTSASDAALLNATISSLTAAQKGVLTQRGIGLAAYSGFPATQTVKQLLLPFPQFTVTNGVGLSPSGAPLGKSWYDALQTTVTKRFSHGLSLNGNFTWSKALALTTSPDIFNRELGKSLNTTDLPFQIRISADYVVPRITHGPKLLTSKTASYILADWGIGWYSNYQSAPLLTRPNSNGGTTSIDKFLGRGPGPAQLVAGQPLYTSDWTDLSGNHHTDELDINCHCFDPTKTVVLNPNAWANVPDGQWGAQQGGIRSFRGIRIPQENLNLLRNFRIREKMSLQIRAEFQNIFNRTQLPQPSSNLGVNFQTTPTQTNGLYTGGFGTVVPTGGTVNARTGLLIGRFTF